MQILHGSLAYLQFPATDTILFTATLLSKSVQKTLEKRYKFFILRWFRFGIREFI